MNPAKSFALDKALARQTKPEPRTSTVLPTEHPLDCSCGPCEDDRRVHLGVRPKDESAYPHFVRGKGMHAFLSRDPVTYSPEKVAEIRERTQAGLERFKELQRRMRGL